MAAAVENFLSIILLGYSQVVLNSEFDDLLVMPLLLYRPYLSPTPARHGDGNGWYGRQLLVAADGSVSSPAKSFAGCTSSRQNYASFSDSTQSPIHAGVQSAGGIRSINMQPLSIPSTHQFRL